MVETIRTGVTFGPTGDWDGVVRAAILAEELGLDAVGFWDHYHSIQPEWALTCGWSAYGFIAARTSRIKLTPMVLCRPNHLLGVLAKESSILQIASGGRFELGVGAGDFEGEFTAWNVHFPDVGERLAALEESVQALRQIWQGELVTLNGETVRLINAACTPTAPTPPRVVIGAGDSRRLIARAVSYADEINVYGREEIVAFASSTIAASGRHVALSVFAERPDGQIPADLTQDISRWASYGVSRYFLTLGFDDDLSMGVRQLAASTGQA
jgi:alkanesulfonate monooxygenase SsuD/methylene tetrahydromethanopterin reductase-like flavin-dependent oxidoreductase (luciferase family)